MRYGYQRIHVVLRREAWMTNRNRVYRLYWRGGLSPFERTLGHVSPDELRKDHVSLGKCLRK